MSFDTTPVVSPATMLNVSAVCRWSISGTVCYYADQSGAELNAKPASSGWFWNNSYKFRLFWRETVNRDVAKVDSSPK
jgi:hypothetical protein